PADSGHTGHARVARTLLQDLGSSRGMAIAVVTYSQHARDRMDERSISKGQVERTIAQPDRLTYEGSKLVAERRTSAGNTIRVVYVERLTDDGTAAHVVTVIRISGD
ncbi:MAG: hypothetical protein QOF73_1251, partial [Thermomicrobiales bacterium]|nr:hypothetical protein [Thermomicrobiales bacterium]